MRVIYRSASKLRLHSNIYSWVIEATKSAVALFVEKVGQGTITRFVFSAIAWIIFSSCLPLELLVVSLAWAHSIVLIPIVRWLEPDAEDIQVQDKGSFATYTKDEKINSELVTLLITVEGSPPDINLVRKNIHDLVLRANENGKTDSKLEQYLEHRLGCQIWKKDKDFDISNHVTLESEKWGGVILTKDALRYWVDDFCNGPLPCNHPPWKVSITPYQDGRMENHAIIVRIHQQLVYHFKLSDILTECEPINITLKKTLVHTSLSEVVEKIPFPPTDFESATKILKHIARIGQKFIRLAWVAPWILYTELLCSCRYWMPRHFGRRVRNRTKVLFWSEEFPKSLIRKIANETGASSNSILVSCLSGALRQYYKVTGERTPDDILAYIPMYDGATLQVDESSASEFRTIALPMGVTDPINRLKTIKKRLTIESPIRQELSRVALRYITYLPPFLKRLAVDFISKKYLAVINNVYVSDITGMVFGSKATNLLYWRPLLNYTGMSLSLMNYHDKVTLAVLGKRESIQRPDFLVDAFKRELLDLALSLNIRMERKSTPPPSP